MQTPQATLRREGQALPEQHALSRAGALHRPGGGGLRWQRVTGARGGGAGGAAGSVPLAGLPMHIAGHLSRAARMGQRLVRLRLHPPELGHLEIHLHLKDNALQVRIKTADAMVKELIETQLEQLHAALKGHGFHLEQLIVVLPQTLSGMGDPGWSGRPGGREPGHRSPSERSAVSQGGDAELQAVEHIGDVLDRGTEIDYRA